MADNPDERELPVYLSEVIMQVLKNQHAIMGVALTAELPSSAQVARGYDKTTDLLRRIESTK